MSNVAISVEGLGKRYRIGAGPSEPYGSLRDSLMRAGKAPLNRLRRGSRSDSAARDYWALKDVSFEVKHGEAVGIIGRNGAGKSTLLKVLSRITEPTTGQAIVHGRVGSLLEVGTGFHPELTGRENIYLNGAVMGMSRADIKRRFDEIVDFAGVETYLDTPVKRYSSGMYMRLAFAVAAHLESEILVVDEVLAVGDAGFRRKSQDKMAEVTSNGRTILLVSHDMYAIQLICPRSVVLNNGRIADVGDTAGVVSRYRSLPEGIERRQQRQDYDSPEVQIIQSWVNGSTSQEPCFTNIFDLDLKWSFRVAKPVNVGFGVSITASGGEYLTGLSTNLDDKTYHLEPGMYSMSLLLPKLSLSSGMYVLKLSIMDDTGTFTYAHRSPLAWLMVETPFSFDGLIGLPREWRQPLLESA